MGYFNHPLWELIFSILGNSGRSPGAHWRTSYLDKADIPCPRTCLGEDDAFTGDLYVQWNSKESVLEKDETELDAMIWKDYGCFFVRNLSAKETVYAMWNG